jgi:tRNA nucleotidyltransferase/poly(A) polymerase
MYKVLVTTLSHSGLNYEASIAVHIAVHTVVIEFDNLKDAEIATERINEQHTSAYDYRQRALLLF